jgi:hypothetical protein
MALKALFCSGNDASLQHWIVLSAIYGLNPPKLYPLAERIVAHRAKTTEQGARLYVWH